MIWWMPLYIDDSIFHAIFTRKIYLRIEISIDRFLLEILIRSEESPPRLSLPSAGVTDNEDRVPDKEDLLQLHDLHDEVLLRLQLQVTGGVLHRLFELLVPFPWNVQIWEEVWDEAQEDRSVIGHDLWHIEVSESAHEDLVLRPLSVASLEHPGHHQHRLDRPQAPVIVVLLGEQLFAQLVQGDELAGEWAA